jgi:hypothetical protein
VEVAQRVDASARGRHAMDYMQRFLRSQVCTTYSSYPISAAKADTVTLTADISDGSQQPVLHTFTYDAGTKTLTDSFIKGTAGTPVTFSGAPRVETLATTVEQSGTNPVFRYYAYPATAPASGTMEPSVELVPPAGAGLSPGDLGRIARVDLNFVTTGETVKTTDIKAEQTNQVFVRIADPNDPNGFNPTCT